MQGKISLIFPDLDEPLSAFGTRIRSFSPPLGLLYLASYLCDRFDVQILDFSSGSLDEFQLKKAIQDSDAIGISVTNYTIRSVNRLVREIKSARPDLPVVLGGPEVDSENHEIYGDVDVLVYGEAELIVEDVFKALLSGDPKTRDERLSRCPGITFKNQTGRLVDGLPYEPILDLDSLRFPLREIVVKTHYTLFGVSRPGIGTSIITSRGCPFKCRFCTRSAFKLRKYRERNPQNVIDEIKRIYQQGYRVLYIVDDNFTVNMRRTERILKGIISGGIKMSILAQGRVTSASDELFAMMREAGFVLISFGLESGNQDVLDFYGKGTTVEQGTKSVMLADKYDMFTSGSFILGAPIETQKHLERTIRYARTIPLDAAFFSVLNYAKGSELWEKYHRAGLISANENNVMSDSRRKLGNFPAEYLQEMASRSQIKFYFRPQLWRRYVRKITRCKDRDFVKALVRGFARFWVDHACRQLSG